MLPLRIRVDPGTMAMKGYSAFPKAPPLLELNPQIVISWTPVVRGVLTPLQRSSWCVLQPQSTRQYPKEENKPYFKELVQLWLCDYFPESPNLFNILCTGSLFLR